MYRSLQFFYNITTLAFLFLLLFSFPSQLFANTLAFSPSLSFFQIDMVDLLLVFFVLVVFLVCLLLISVNLSFFQKNSKKTVVEYFNLMGQLIGVMLLSFLAITILSH